MTYSGPCYDGPLEGKRLDSSLKRVPFIVRGGKQIEVWHGSPSNPLPYKSTEYIWSAPIRKWVYRG
jgi:hypothetical protein